ncbi:MAG: AAA family ATPase [Clostridia bacterium]|nr:AAA family ATPase [Clostridia bacterium]
MFTYVKAKNFKSLKNIKFNLKRTQKITNDFISIYGENGSGKTNVVELFKFLQQLTISKSIDNALNKLPKEYFELQKKFIDSIPVELKKIWQLSLNLEEYRTLNEKEDTEIEYGFKINDIEGYYYIRFNTEIVEEKLYYFAVKQKAFYFKICKEEKEIKKELNKNIFNNEKYKKELIDNIDKYWGKYSFLSLLFYETAEKNQDYVITNTSQKIFNIIDKFLSMTIHVHMWDFKLMPDNIMKQSKLIDLKSGNIRKDKVNIIKKYEEVLNIFFTQAYADIKSVEYKIEDNDEKVYYELYFNKMIGGKLKSISIDLESEGTRKIVDEFDTIIGAMMGETVIIDEIDNGIHDLLMKNIIMSIKDEINGQLIITTHNTLLLEILPKECIYILSTDYEGNKEINSIKDYGITIQKNNNARDLYFKGLFGGIPTTEYVDFEEIKYALEDSKEKEDISNVKKA